MTDPDMESLHKLKSRFIANITHEFRTPLAAISASVEYLLEELDCLTMPEIKELLASVNLSLSNLQTLIDNLLESASIEAGHFRVFVQPIEIMDTVDEAVRMVAPIFQRREQDLIIESLEELPMIKGDHARLVQVLVNLLSNASKFGPIGGVVWIKLEALDGEFLRIRIVDQGTGISLGNREDLFRRFINSDDRDGFQNGIGLGLSIVRVIIEEHGGRVGVDAEVEGGTLFWFTVPCVVDAGAHSTHAAREV